MKHEQHLNLKAEGRQLKDYIHLYFGGLCKIVWTEEGSELTGLEDALYRIDGTIIDNSNFIESGELILRPLSSITEDERFEVFKLLFGDDAYSAIRLGFALKTDSLGADAVRYLISKHFDIFELIDSGIAISEERGGF